SGRLLKPCGTGCFGARGGVVVRNYWAVGRSIEQHILCDRAWYQHGALWHPRDIAPPRCRTYLAQGRVSDTDLAVIWAQQVQKSQTCRGLSRPVGALQGSNRARFYVKTQPIRGEDFSIPGPHGKVTNLNRGSAKIGNGKRTSMEPQCRMRDGLFQNSEDFFSGSHTIRGSVEMSAHLANGKENFRR